MTATTSVVIKRSGQAEERDITKVQRVLAWATTGYNDDSLTPIENVSASALELRANIQYYDGMPTSEVHASLVTAAEQLISVETPNYDHVAARLLWFALRKEAYDSHRVPSIYSLVKTGVAEGFYDPELLQVYTEEDWRGMDILVDHRRDDLLRYAGVRQVQNKYAIHDRTGRIRETPQIVYLMAAATLYQNYPREARLGWISRYYNQLSLQKVSLPSPVMNGVRTPSRQFSSCVLIDTADELTSIGAVGTAALMYGAKRAGLGINMGRLRAEGQDVAGGLFKAAGPVPFFKFERSAVKGCSQSGMREASATMNYPFWHLDFFTLIELKNNKGTEDERVRNVDYCVHLNRVIFERIADDGYLTLFSPEEVPDLYEAFYSSDIDRFRQLYEKAEANPQLTKKQVPVMQLVNKLLTERWETGRIYIMFADTANRQTPIEEPIYMTNLCVEILQHTSPIDAFDQARGLIALCTLSAINWANIKSLADMMEACELAVRALDELLGYQDYLHPAARRHTQMYRPLGVGVINFAYWYQAQGFRWGEGLEDVSRMAEMQYYCLMKASVQLAKEKGACERPGKYARGWLAFDEASIPVTLHLGEKLWNDLRADMIKYGVRFATVAALMPSEASSIVSNALNGTEPPRALVTNKGSKDGRYPQVAPGIGVVDYQLGWDIYAHDYLTTLARFQPFTDQGMSANTTYDARNYPEHQVTLDTLLDDLTLAYELGYKTLYYNNQNKVQKAGTDAGIDDLPIAMIEPAATAEPEPEMMGCGSGACAI